MVGDFPVETALLRHPAVAGAGVTGHPDDILAEMISAFVVLRSDHAASPALSNELVSTVPRELGPVAAIRAGNVVRTLPKTRSGKIMRRLFKAVVLDRDPADISAFKDAGSVEEARAAWRELRVQVRDA